MTGTCPHCGGTGFEPWSKPWATTEDKPVVTDAIQELEVKRIQRAVMRRVWRALQAYGDALHDGCDPNGAWDCATSAVGELEDRLDRGEDDKE